MIGKEQLVNKARELRSQSIEEMTLQFFDMALAAEISEKEAKDLHRLKGKLLMAVGDKRESLIVRNIYHNEYKQEMKLAGSE